MRLLLLLFLIICFFTNCSRSLVYSPSLGLATEPLTEKQLDLQAGAELMPETRPGELEGRSATLGFSGRLAYGFSDRFTLGVQGWADLEGRTGNYRGGYALQGQFYRVLSPESRLVFLPKAGIAIDGSTVRGYGLEGALVYQKTIKTGVSYYAGGGLAWGIHELERQSNDKMEEKIPMGFGLMGHLGLSWQLAGRFRLNAEVHSVYQINIFDETQQFLLSPHIGLGYTLNRNKLK